ncbi:MAG: hypothetical protein Q9185_007022 [Variospora sp. 1 TL-2023]
MRIMGTSTWRKNFLYFLIAANFLFCILAVIFTFAQCRPSRALWDPSVKGKCWNPESQAGFSLFTGTCIPTLRPLFLTLLERPSSEAFRRHMKSYHSHSGSSHRARNTKMFAPPNDWRIIGAGPTNKTWFDDASDSRIIPEHDSQIRQTIELDVTTQPRSPNSANLRPV